MYLVVACPRCRRAKVVEQGRKTTTCGSCARTLQMADLRAHATTVDLDEARQAAGMLNARLAGREEEFLAAQVAPSPRAARLVPHESAHHAAAAAARHAHSESDRADALARGLAKAQGHFGEEDLRRAFELAGLDPARAGRHLVRMLSTDVVYEPRPGQYKAF